MILWFGILDLCSEILVWSGSFSDVGHMAIEHIDKIMFLVLKDFFDYFVERFVGD